MSSKIGNLIEQESTTGGTGDLSLNSVAGSKRDFSDEFSTGGSNVFRYHIYNMDTAGEWEVGLGHLSDSTTLVRDTVTRSSNSNSTVDFTANDTLKITCDIIADEIIDPRDGSAGQIPETDGTNFSFVDKPSGGIWTEDGNSPISGTGQVSYTYNISDTFDLYKVIMDVEMSGDSYNGLRGQINGVTASHYDTQRFDGSTIKNISSGQVLRTHPVQGDKMTVEFFLRGRFANIGRWIPCFGVGKSQQITYDNTGQFSRLDTDSVSISSPLTQFTIITSDESSTFDLLSIEVFGRDLG